MNFDNLVGKKFSNDKGNVYEVVMVTKCAVDFRERIIAKSTFGQTWDYESELFLEKFDCTREVK